MSADLLTEYEVATGEIVGNLRQPIHMPYTPAEGYGVLEGHFSDNDFYVVNGEPTLRPVISLPVTQGPAPLELDLSYLPEGLTGDLKNESNEVMEIQTPIEPISLLDPGEYRLEIPLPFPYLMDDGGLAIRVKVLVEQGE